jgi:hypothetical protein
MVKLVKDKLQDSSIEQYKMKNELYWLKNSFGRNVLKVIEDYGNDLIAPDEHVQG